LKEGYVAPAPPPSAHAEPEEEESVATYTSMLKDQKVEERPKIQPREVAQKAIKEIKGVPPKLMLYSIAGAVALILVIGIAVTFYVHSLNSDIHPGAGRPAEVAQPEEQPVASQPAPAPTP